MFVVNMVLDTVGKFDIVDMGDMVDKVDMMDMGDKLEGMEMVDRMFVPFLMREKKLIKTTQISYLSADILIYL